MNSFQNQKRNARQPVATSDAAAMWADYRVETDACGFVILRVLGDNGHMHVIK